MFLYSVRCVGILFALIGSVNYIGDNRSHLPIIAMTKVEDFDHNSIERGGIRWGEPERTPH